MLPSSDPAGNHLLLKRAFKRTYSILPNLEKASLGKRLRHLRKKWGLSVSDLARESGAGQKGIEGLEHGKLPLKVELLSRVLRVFGESLREVIPGEGDICDLVIPVRDFGSWLRNFRLKRGLSQGELARRWGVSYVCVSRYEANSVKPTAHMIERLKRAYKLGDEALASLPPDGPNFASWLRAFRRRKGLTQVELAKLWHVSESSVWAFETKGALPKPAAMNRLKENFKLNGELDAFIRG